MPSSVLNLKDPHFKNRKTKASAGFTLIEVLVASAILALMALALHGQDARRRSSLAIMGLAAVGATLFFGMK